MSREDQGEAVREATRKRAAVLAELIEGPARKPALVDAVGVSRSTVDRAVGELSAAGLAVAAGGTVRATPAGELALSARREYESFTDGLGAAGPLLEALPDGAPLDRSLFAGATVTIADPGAPEAALRTALDALADADRLCGFAPVVKSNYAALVGEQVLERGLEVELLVERDTLESAAAVARDREVLADLFAADEVDLRVVDEPLPYALWIADGGSVDGAVAGLTVHDGGGIVGVLSNDRPDAVAWARETYRDRREGSEPARPGVAASD